MSIDHEHVREEMRLRHDDELLDILAERNEEEWAAEVFAVIEEVLRERGVAVAGEVARLQAERAPEPAVRPVILATFDDMDEAQACQMALVREGIEAVLRDSGEVLVPENREADALALLEAAEREAEESSDFKCPSCGFAADPLEEEGRKVCQVCGEQAF